MNKKLFILYFLRALDNLFISIIMSATPTEFVIQRKSIAGNFLIRATDSANFTDISMNNAQYSVLKEMFLNGVLDKFFDGKKTNEKYVIMSARHQCQISRSSSPESLISASSTSSTSSTSSSTLSTSSNKNCFNPTVPKLKNALKTRKITFSTSLLKQDLIDLLYSYINDQKIDTLQQWCRKYGVLTTGSKINLIERLQTCEEFYD